MKMGTTRLPWRYDIVLDPTRIAGFPPDLPTLRLLRGTRRAIMGATASREMGRATSPRGYRALSRARKNPVLALARGEEEGAEPLDKHQERGMKIVAEIASLHQRVERTIDRLRAKLDEANELVNDSNRFGSLDYWRLVAFSDGMIKIRLIIEQNFCFIETFGILATSRYMLELLIWFRLLTADPTYSFTYVKQLITDKRDHAKEHLSKVKKEIELFKQLEKQESAESEAVVRGKSVSVRSNSESLPRSARMIADEIDRLARRQFCLYSKDAKTRGFGYQAYLMETQVLPQLEQEVEQLQTFKTAAISQMPKSAEGHKPWRWKEQAAAAGMSDQFEFVYAYTSRLLHATPTSMTTNKKNLEHDEVATFLDFLYVSILDAIEMSERLAGLTDPSAN
jgi:hypothetical protein